MTGFKKLKYDSIHPYDQQNYCCNTANSMLNHLLFFCAFGRYHSVSLSNLHQFHIGGLQADLDNALHIYSGRRIGRFLTRSHLCEPISTERSELPLIRL